MYIALLILSDDIFKNVKFAETIQNYLMHEFPITCKVKKKKKKT